MISKKNLVLIASIAVVLAVLALSGCTSPSVQPTPAPVTAKYPMNITDDYGRTATIGQEPQRIVSLSSENTEILFALGLGDRIVGDNDYDNYPAAAANKTHVGGLTNVNVEGVAALDPDVVFANTLNPKDTVNTLDSLGYEVVVNNITNVQGIDDAILRIGNICNASDNATKLVSAIDANLSGITNKTGALNASQKPKVLMLVDIDYLYVAGSNTYGNDLIQIAGGINAASGIDDYKVMSKEAIMEADPDIIIVPVDRYSQAAYDGLINGRNQSWMKDMKAVKNGRVYAINADIISRQGPRVVDGAAAMAKDIHPKLFP